MCTARGFGEGGETRFLSFYGVFYLWSILLTYTLLGG